jgi:hypothetical protein
MCEMIFVKQNDELNDRELLEQAAKAAGYRINGSVSGGLWISTNKGRSWQEWNPLTDDGECARMEAEAEIELEWFPIGVKATHYFTSKFVKFEDHNNDKNAARRYASTLVAAEIGKGIK